jgi:mannose-6-phosphate isomerase-like protein (cupin superfamily)
LRLPLIAAGVSLGALALSPSWRADAQAPATPGVLFWKSSEAFAKGPLLLDRMASNQYQVFAVRRDAPGSVEHHALDTDIVMVLEGAATFVTEGVITEPRTLRANEQTGSGIRDGRARRVARGDVIVVPNGTPHWFREVMPAIRYFAVKLRQASADVHVPSRVEHWTASDAFAKGGRLFQSTDGPFVRIDARRSDKPLGVERHDLDTDLVFTLGGGGTYLTGGAIAAQRPLGPNESTGEGVTGGTARLLEPGDVLAIPPGMPHWLRDVSGPIEFFAVKVR